ncbi:MAG: type 4 pilus major pilin [Rhodobacteraceae bacterium]|nr:type 4 pilus major pilin [Paracoccaceae bacterium]MCY4196180.1 type 4 pilus major pilin [Paracoccaceae bacterium]MCY4327674.1 type 4 pilus major pilin [Paracoccaceae bacterium]
MRQEIKRAQIGVQRRHRAERGATLIEAVLFTVIALGLVTGGVVLYEQATKSARTNETVRMLTSLQSQVRALFQSQASFGTADLASVLIAANAMPSAFQKDSNSDGDNDALVSPFGSDVTVTGATSSFTVEIEDVPVDICARVVAFDASGNGLAGTGIISVSDGTATDSDGMTSAQAATFCTTNDSGGEVALTWTFGK